MIDLYTIQGCPFCAKVLRKADELGLTEGKEFRIIDAPHGSKEREQLIALGGQSMVPFIVDGDVKMYESDDIVAYLEKKFR